MRTGENIGLIAMSNAGKSRLAEKLAFVEFNWVSIARLIRAALIFKKV